MSEGFHLACKRFPGRSLSSSAADPGAAPGLTGHCQMEGSPVLMIIYHLSFSLNDILSPEKRSFPAEERLSIEKLGYKID